MAMSDWRVQVRTGYHTLDDDIPETTFTSDQSFKSERQAQDVADKFASFLGVEASVGQSGDGDD